MWLVRSHKILGTAALVSTHYPAPGGRHDWVLALAGTLKRLGVTETETELVIVSVSAHAGDSDAESWAAEVKSTYARDDVTQASHLIELSSVEFVRALTRVWGTGGGSESAVSTELLREVERMNLKHAVVHLSSGEVTVLTERGEDEETLLSFTEPHGLRILYPQTVPTGVSLKTGDVTAKKLGDAWLEHEKRRFYPGGLALAPPGRRAPLPGSYNLWKGFSVEPKRGDWGLFREHIKLLVGGNQDHLRYVLAWMRETVRNPGRQIGVALSFRGGTGTGKTSFATWFGKLFGKHFLPITSSEQLVGRFNEHLHETLLLFADEAVWAAGKGGLGTLKSLVTSDTLTIEAKFRKPLVVPNMVHLIIASNETWVVPAGIDDRRFAVFDVSDAHKDDAEFFESVSKQLFADGGLSALLYDMLEDSGEDTNLKKIPTTAARAEQQESSMTPKQEWWYEMLLEGNTIWDEGRGNTIERDRLYQIYKQMTEDAHKHADHGSRVSLGRFLQSVLPESFPRTDRPTINGHRTWVYIFPTLDTCRKSWEKIHRGVTWPNVREPGEEG